MKKEAQNMKGNTCMYCGNMDCRCRKSMFFVKGVILLILGYLLLTGRWSLEGIIGLLLILFGIKSLFFSARCR